MALSSPVVGARKAFLDGWVRKQDAMTSLGQKGQEERPCKVSHRNRKNGILGRQLSIGLRAYRPAP